MPVSTRRASVRLLGAGIVSAATLALPAVACAAWHQPGAGSALNDAAAAPAVQPAIATSGGSPFVTWSEQDGANHSVQVSALGANDAFGPAAAPLNAVPSADATLPSIAFIGGAVPFVAWQETNSTTGTAIQAAELTQTGAVQVGRPSAPANAPVTFPVGSLTSTNPSIASVTTAQGAAPFVAFQAALPVPAPFPQALVVTFFDGAHWNLTGAPLNRAQISGLGIPAANAAHPSLTSVGSGVPGAPTTLYVAWAEGNGVSAQQVFVDTFTQDSGEATPTWKAVGGSLNTDTAHAADRPSITGVAGVPFVAFEQSNAVATQIRVSALINGAWVPFGAALNVDPARNATQPSIAFIGALPLVGWTEVDAAGHSQARVAALHGATWAPVGGSLNVDPTQNASNLTITNVGGVPYVSWSETTSGGPAQVRSARLEPDFVAAAAFPSANAALLGVSVNDYGVSLPVRFEYGVGTNPSNVLAAVTTTGAGVGPLAQPIDGLSPLTAYSWRAFGTDTVRRTSSTPLQSFSTPAATAGPGGGGGPAFAGLALTTRSLTLNSRGNVSPQFSCPLTGTATACNATVIVQGRALVKAKGKRKAGQRGRTIRFTVASFRVPAGRTASQTLHLSSATQRLVKTLRRAKATLVLGSADDARHTHLSSYSVSIRPAAASGR